MQEPNSINISLSTIKHSEGPERSLFSNYTPSLHQAFEQEVRDPHDESGINSLQPHRRKLWYLTFPIALCIWPLIRIMQRGATGLTFGMFRAFPVLYIFASIITRSFPSILCMYFYVIYSAVVLIEFSAFMAQPYEGLWTTIDKAFIFCNGLTLNRTKRTSQRLRTYAIVITPIIVLPIVSLLFFYSGCYIYDDDWKENSLLALNSLIQIQNYDDATGGYCTHPYLNSAASAALIVFGTLNAYEIAAFYKAKQEDFEEINQGVTDFVNTGDVKKMVETSNFYKKLGNVWKKDLDLLRIIDFIQTIATTLLLLPLFSLFFKWDLGFLKRYTQFTPTNEIYLVLTIAACILCGVLCFLYKLFCCLKWTTSYNNKLILRFDDINRQLNLIIDSPESFVRSLKNVHAEPKPNDLIRYSDIFIIELPDIFSFKDTDKLIKPIVQSIKNKRESQEIAYKDLERLISKKAKRLIRSYDFLKQDYLNLYNIIEYKLLGIVPLQSDLVKKLFAAAGAGILGGAYTFIKDISNRPHNSGGGFNNVPL